MCLRTLKLKMLNTYNYLNVNSSGLIFQAKVNEPATNIKSIQQTLVGAQSLIASVNESKENLFSSNLMPLPPKFEFQERQGRINWRALLNCNLD